MIRREDTVTGHVSKLCVEHCLSLKTFIPNFVAFFVSLGIVITCIHKMLFSVTSAKRELTPARHCFIIHLLGGGHCPLVRDSEPIILLETPTSPSLYMLIIIKLLNLGVIMNQHLKLDRHVNKVFKVCMFHLRNISKIRRFLTTVFCKLLIHALVTSRLDYCNSILCGCNQSILQRLQFLQNYAARLVYRIPKFCHITPYLKDLHWLPVQARIQFKLLSIVFKCIHGTGPHYLLELLCRRTMRPGLRSAYSFKLYSPRTQSRAERSTADRAFSISGPKLWNQLPASIQNNCSLDVFKFRLNI